MRHQHIAFDEAASETIAYSGCSRRPPAFIEWETTGVSWGSTGPMAYSLSQPVAVPEQRREVTRPVAAFLAGVGLLIGLFVTPAILAEMPRPGRALATRVQPREPALETTPLASPARQKVATKRNVRPIGNAVHPATHTAATAATATTAARPPANEPGDDTQTSSDLKLLLAAQAERSL